jgi:hypothetical protein
MYYYGNKITEDDKIKKYIVGAQRNPTTSDQKLFEKKWVFSLSQHSFLDLAISKTAVLHLGSMDMFHGTVKLNGGGTSFSLTYN